METIPQLTTREEVMFFDTDCGGVVHNLAYLRMIETCRTRLAALVERSAAVAVASGGVWILGAVSGEERRRIVAIRTGLGEPEPDLLAGPAEFPH